MSWEDVAQVVTVKPGDGVMVVEYGGHSVTCAGTLWQEAVDEAITLLCDAPEPFENVLREEGARWQAIQFNPKAALQKRIFADGFAPNSPEFDFEHGGIWYVGQRAEHPLTGEVRYYYVPFGQWESVRWAG